MISEIKFNNYRFFSDESSFSFVADRRTKKLLSNSVLLDNKPILKSLALYGNNNSGKTNIIYLFRSLKQLFLGKENISFNSTKIFRDPAVVSVSITFNNNDGMGWIKYEFDYDCDEHEFIKEKISNIYYYDTGNPRVDDVFEFDRNAKVLMLYDVDLSRYLDMYTGSKPFVYSVRVEDGEFKSLKPYKQAFEEFGKSLIIINLYNIPINSTLEAFKTNNIRKTNFITSFAKHADLSIDNLSFANESEISLSVSKVNEKALDDISQVPDALRLMTSYKKAKVPSIFFDSSGTKKIEAIAAYIYDSLFEGKTLIIDELDNGLHFMLTRAIVSLFNNIENTKGQLFFTAHDLQLVDCSSLLRKEQIYFVSRNKEFAEIKCLGDLTVADTGIREGTDLLKRYYKGDFGPVPSPTFISDLLRGKEYE